jgi:hypothetical protein
MHQNAGSSMQRAANRVPTHVKCCIRSTATWIAGTLDARLEPAMRQSTHAQDCNGIPPSTEHLHYTALAKHTQL